VEHLLRALVACVTLALSGCFNFDAAGHCYGADASCSIADTAPQCGSQASRCAGSTAALCDGFEGDALTPRWYVYDGGPGATYALDQSRTCRGESSLHVHLEPAAAASSPQMMLEETETDRPTPMTNRWIRAFVFVPSTSLTQNFNRLIIAGQVAAPYRQIEFGVVGGNVAVNDELASGSPMTRSTRAWPTDEWVCVVLAVTPGSPGEVNVAIDGSAVPDLQISAETNPSPPLAAVRIGSIFGDLAAAQGAVDVWIDELAIDAAPLDCAN
jgi:hypothetical protein